MHCGIIVGVIPLIILKYSECENKYSELRLIRRKWVHVENRLKQW